MKDLVDILGYQVTGPIPTLSIILYEWLFALSKVSVEDLRSTNDQLTYISFFIGNMELVIREWSADRHNTIYLNVLKLTVSSVVAFKLSQDNN